MYWFATNLGAPGPTTPLVREMIRQIVARPGGADRFLQVVNHDLGPSALFTPPHALAAAFAVLRAGGARPGTVARDLSQVVRQEASRSWQRRRPRYQPMVARSNAEPAPVPVTT